MVAAHEFFTEKGRRWSYITDSFWSEKNVEAWLVQCPRGTVLLEPMFYLKPKRERRVILGLVSFQKTERKRSHSWLGKRDRARLGERNIPR